MSVPLLSADFAEAEISNSRAFCIQHTEFKSNVRSEETHGSR